MKKYLIICGTLAYHKVNKTWYYDGDTMYNINDIYNETVYDNLDEALKVYNKIELKDDIQKNHRNSDYKALYVSNNEIDIDDYDLDDFELIKDDYSFVI